MRNRSRSAAGMSKVDRRSTNRRSSVGSGRSSRASITSRAAPGVSWVASQYAPWAGSPMSPKVGSPVSVDSNSSGGCPDLARQRHHSGEAPVRCRPQVESDADPLRQDHRSAGLLGHQHQTHPVGLVQQRPERRGHLVERQPRRSRARIPGGRTGGRPELQQQVLDVRQQVVRRVVEVGPGHPRVDPPISLATPDRTHQQPGRRLETPVRPADVDGDLQADLHRLGRHRRDLPDQAGHQALPSRPRRSGLGRELGPGGEHHRGRVLAVPHHRTGAGGAVAGATRLVDELHQHQVALPVTADDLPADRSLLGIDPDIRHVAVAGVDHASRERLMTDHRDDRVVGEEPGPHVADHRSRPRQAVVTRCSAARRVGSDFPPQKQTKSASASSSVQTDPGAPLHGRSRRARSMTLTRYLWALRSRPLARGSLADARSGPGASFANARRGQPAARSATVAAAPRVWRESRAFR